MKQIVIPAPKSKFLEVECKKCKEKSIVFSKPAMKIECPKCGEVLVESTGGHARISGKVKNVLA